MKPIKYVYIAGPYTKPVPNHNVFKAIEAANRVLIHYIPFVPHLSHFWDTMTPKDYEDWMRLDFAWIERCDCVIRLPGESSGADREVAHALAMGIPVFMGLEAFYHFYHFASQEDRDALPTGKVIKFDTERCGHCKDERPVAKHHDRIVFLEHRTPADTRCWGSGKDVKEWNYQFEED